MVMREEDFELFLRMGIGWKEEEVKCFHSKLKEIKEKARFSLSSGDGRWVNGGIL
jgi:hypothetical protein